MSKAPAQGRNFSIYLDNSRARDARVAAYIFNDPDQIIIARKSGEIAAAFLQIQQALADGNHVAGWISYECGLLLEDKLAPRARESYDLPFLMLGVFKNRHRLNSYESGEYWAGAQDGAYTTTKVMLNISREEYEETVAKIHEFLKAGDIYQVNYTLKSRFGFSGSRQSYFAALRKAQQVEFGAYMTWDDMSLLSLSPELFFQKRGRQITVRPMKGTGPRGRNLAEDRARADALQKDEKNRAENLMIVDLLRNDLAKISSPGSVKLKSLYDVEKYRTLFQMTSTIVAEAADDLHLTDMIRALFPCGSVTGAPKIRAMEIISELEQEPRGIYTGAIGYMTPGGDCCFSVPIRTIIIDKNGEGEMGMGSAIVADSDARSEYDECLLKARFATGEFSDFDLIESLRWTETEGYFLLGAHMARLKSSAEYFDFSCHEEAIIEALQDHASWLDRGKNWKVRLLLSRGGEISITSQAIENNAQKKTISLSREGVDSQNALLFHKTTDRELFNRELLFHQQAYGSYDVIFFNEKGHLTEGAYNNIFVEREGILHTPPVTDGLLNGILRQSLMADRSRKIIERHLTIDDLRQADKIYLGNSVRGLVDVCFKDQEI